MNKIMFFALTFTLLLSACGAPAVQTATATQNGIEILSPWVRATAMKSETGNDSMHTDSGAVTGAFMLIKNGNAEADTLVSASSDAAEMVQIHETTMQDGVMSMGEVSGIEIPAEGMVELKSGSYHIMLIGLKRELKEGETVTVTLSFKNAGNIVIEIPVKMP